MLDAIEKLLTPAGRFGWQSMGAKNPKNDEARRAAGENVPDRSRDKKKDTKKKAAKKTASN